MQDDTKIQSAEILRSLQLLADVWEDRLADYSTDELVSHLEQIEGIVEGDSDYESFVTENGFEADHLKRLN